MAQTTDHDVLIRDATLADAPDVADLTSNVFVGEGYSPSSAEASLRDVDRRRSLGDVIVAEDPPTGQIVGTVSLVRSGELRRVATDEEFEIHLLAVDPSVRGRGIGRALLSECVRRARASEAAVLLSTQPSMQAAQHLYATAGFQRVPKLDWRTSDGRAMLVYRLSIDQHSAR